VDLNFIQYMPDGAGAAIKFSSVYRALPARKVEITGNFVDGGTYHSTRKAFTDR